jgi:hypothetical protein
MAHQQSCCYRTLNRINGNLYDTTWIIGVRGKVWKMGVPQKDC